MERQKDTEVDQIRNSHFQQLEHLKNLHETELDSSPRKHKRGSEHSLQFNDTHSGITDQSHLGDITGSLSQDMQRIEYFKAQEQENVELKGKVKLIDSKFKEVVSKFNQKIAKKNTIIQNLAQRLREVEDSERETEGFGENALGREITEAELAQDRQN